jgi:putative transposase
MWHTRRMRTLSPNRYKNHRFPTEIISHGVWLYFRFCLSYRDVEELLFARGIIVSYEAIRQWCRKFGQAYANQLRRQRPRPGDTWHLDEVFLTIKGERHYLWRSVDQDGHVLDILVQSRRNKNAAKKFFRKLLKGLTYVPRVIITTPSISGSLHVRPTEIRSSLRGQLLSGRAQELQNELRAVSLPLYSAHSYRVSQERWLQAICRAK